MTVCLYELSDNIHIVEVPDLNGETAVTVTVKKDKQTLRNPMIYA